MNSGSTVHSEGRPASNEKSDAELVADVMQLIDIVAGELALSPNVNQLLCRADAILLLLNEGQARAQRSGGTVESPVMDVLRREQRKVDADIAATKPLIFKGART